MCLEVTKNTRKKFTFFPKTVYKFVIIKKDIESTEQYTDEKMFTPFRYKFIEFNKVYHSQLRLQERDEFNLVDIGLHSFKDIESTRQYIHMGGTRKIIKCVIPAFSFYYEGTFMNDISYASNKIKYLKFVD